MRDTLNGVSRIEINPSRDFRYGLHTSPKARYTNSICADALDMFASQTRDLSHIELARSDNISSSSKARTYRVGEAHISTERKTRARIRGENPSILALSVFIRVWA